MSIYDIGSLVETIVKKDGREEPFNLAKFDKYIFGIKDFKGIYD